MATYEKRVAKRDGHWTFGIQIKVKQADDTYKFVNTTWKNPKNLTGERAERAAIAYGEAWERDYKEALKHGDSNKVCEDTFWEVANEWLELKKPKIAASYYNQARDNIITMSAQFKNKRFIDIRARDVSKLISYLNNYHYERIQAVLRPDTLKEFEDKVKAYGYRKVEREGILCRPSIYNARHGDPIAWSSAEKLCKSLKLNVNYFFDKVVQSKEYAKTTIIKCIHTLSAIYNYGIRNEIIETNFATKIFTGDLIAGREPEKVEILTDEEYKRFIKTLKEIDMEKDKEGNPKNNIWITAPLYVMSLLGLRGCEVNGMKWSDIDLKNRIISVMRDRTYTSGVGVKDGKTKNKTSKRDLYIDDLLYSKLKEYKELYDQVKAGNKDFDKRGYIFCGIDGKPRFPQYLNKLFQRYLAMAECKKITNHKMRHTWITRLITNGASVNEVSGMAGHASIRTTLDVYTDNMKDVKVSKRVLTESLKAE